MKRINSNILLTLIILLGAFLRFYELNWGQGYFFHPDEYHIVIAASRLNSENLDPELYSYGSFTVYLIYATQKLLFFFPKMLQNIPLFLIGRFYSALFSTLTIPFVYLITKKLTKNKYFSLLASFLMALIPGAIQQAHFTTPDSILTFFLTAALYFLIMYESTSSTELLITIGLLTGLAMGTKITAVVFVPLTALIVFSKRSHLIKKLKKLLLYCLAVFVFFFMSFPYSILGFDKFQQTTAYEASVAMGEFPVFYTRSFLETKPIIFQLKNILPYATSPSILILFLIGFAFTLNRITKNRKQELLLIVLMSYFSIFFFPNALLFAKWTRFINPIFPIVVIISVFAVYLINVRLKSKIINTALVGLLVLPTVFWSLMFFRIYIRDDVRIQATNWVRSNIFQDIYILTESANTLEVPLSGNYTKKPFDFYSLDENSLKIKELSIELNKADYFIVQSRRVYANHDKSYFPIVANFYEHLFSGELGFEKIATITSFPGINFGKYNFEINDEKITEETFTVFDHPVISIYKNYAHLSEKQIYERLVSTN